MKDAYGAEDVSLDDEGAPRIEPDVGGPRDQVVLPEALVLGRIEDNQRLLIVDDVAAEGQ